MSESDIYIAAQVSTYGIVLYVNIRLTAHTDGRLALTDHKIKAEENGEGAVSGLWRAHNSTRRFRDQSTAESMENISNDPQAKPRC